MDLIAAGKGLVDGLERLRKLSEELKRADLLELVGTLKVALAELRIQAAEMQEQNLGLRRELQELREKLDFRAKLVFRDDAYYFSEPVAGRPPGPFCQSCFDNRDMLVAMTDNGMFAEMTGKWRCKECVKQGRE